MKATVTELNEKIELALETGSKYSPNEGESKKDLVARISTMVSEEALETLEVANYTLSSLKKKSNKALLEMVEFGVDGLLLEAVTEALASRGVDISDEPTTVPTEEEKKGKSAKAPKAEKKEKDPKAPKAPKAEKKEKAPRVKKEVLTDEQVAELVEKAKSFVGKVLEFIPFGADKTPIKAEVTMISVDRRVNKVYFRMFDTEGKMYHKDVKSPNIQVDEKATKELEAARAKEAKEKEEAAAKAKAEKAEKAKLAKERANAKTAEKADQAAKKKADKAEASKKQNEELN